MLTSVLRTFVKETKSSMFVLIIEFNNVLTF